MPDATSVCSVSMAATQARRRRYLLAALAAAVTGCKLEELPPTPPPAPPPEERTGGLALTGLNYTDVPIGVFYINGKWGGNVSPYAAGFGSTGAVSLPYPWRPGITVEVKWQDDVLYAQDKQALMTEIVEVPEYKNKIYAGFLLVAFFPGRQVRVFASSYVPGQTQTPYGLLNPGKFCNQQPGCPEWYDAGLPPREGHF